MEKPHTFQILSTRVEVFHIFCEFVRFLGNFGTHSMEYVPAHNITDTFYVRTKQIATYYAQKQGKKVPALTLRSYI